MATSNSAPSVASMVSGSMVGDAPLALEACIGFSGKVLGGLKVSPCGEYVVYPLGKAVIVRELRSGARMTFLNGHTKDVSCVALSKDGKWLASGQVNHPGIKADVIIWDMEKAIRNCQEGIPHGENVISHRLKQHLSLVQAVDFSCNGQYLASLGGPEDNSLVVWDVHTGRAICGAPAATDSSLALKWLNRRSDRLVTAGNYNLRVWQIDASLPKIHAVDAKMGSIRRIIQCITIADDDEKAYCGTKTGDLLMFKIDRDGIQSYNDPDSVVPTMADCSREKMSMGIKSVHCFFNRSSGRDNIAVGAGDGTMAFFNPVLGKVRDYEAQLNGGITSIAYCPDGSGFFCSTNLSNRYWVNMKLSAELRGTAHHSRVNDVVFPEGCSSLFLTCSFQDIRIWNSKLRQELLRIQVPNLECNALGITRSGATIVSGWSDGKIRAFYPESGKLKFVIVDAHLDGVTALALAKDDDTRPPWRIISGGQDGRVRVWNVTSSHQVRFLEVLMDG
jgi:WD40 repeat protein